MIRQTAKKLGDIQKVFTITTLKINNKEDSYYNYGSNEWYNYHRSQIKNKHHSSNTFKLYRLMWLNKPTKIKCIFRLKYFIKHCVNGA